MSGTPRSRRGRPAGTPGPAFHAPAVASLRVRIATLGISQVHLAALAGLAPTRLSRLVMGRVRLDRAVELRLHRVLDIEERALAAAEAVRRTEYGGRGRGGARGPFLLEGSVLPVVAHVRAEW